MIRLLIADDHTIVREGLKQIFALVPDIDVVAEAQNSAQILERLRTLAVDIVLLDLNMPGMDGAELVGHVRARYPALPILILTMHNEPQMAAGALKAGANGYITKDSDLDVLLPAIRKVAARGNYLSPELAEKIVFYDSPATQGALHLQLTGRETQVLRLLTQGRGVGEIAQALALSSKTVSTHKVRLMKKMQCDNMAELMRYAITHKLSP
jgi:DNA-binding NarL/FixJ family response regulator